MASERCGGDAGQLFNQGLSVICFSRLDADLDKERAVQVRVARGVVELDVSVALLKAVQRDAVRGNHVRELEVFVLHHEPEEHELVVLIVHTELE